VLILYSDGVNGIIDGYWLFRQENRCTRDPASVMGALLADHTDLEFMRDVFDHDVESKWNGPDGNRAVELLGNILAGRDPVRMTQVLDPELLSDEGERDIYVDDTTIIVCPLS
jgi:pyruvate dehydrogenase phosphatase